MDIIEYPSDQFFFVLLLIFIDISIVSSSNCTSFNIVSKRNIIDFTFETI
ncbi:putative BTB_POZ domain-containing protein [Megavirus courdo7]|uniref:Putative BTB_POZ domain-containing protein n=1 Tax=Megavirus courdo7 TaxID=1128135 RepID=H2EA50_9VIRU|nr:putative BTB_POZ domain-containing protein [Megavirus courdo7]